MTEAKPPICSMGGFCFGVTYRTAYFGFPLEALPEDGDRETVVAALLDWCSSALDHTLYLPLAAK